MIGVNKFQTNEDLAIKLRKVDPKEEGRQIEKVRQLKKERDNKEVKKCLGALKEAVADGENSVQSLIEAVKAYATIGEICDALRSVYGEYNQLKF